MRTVYIEDNTPEGKWLLELIKNHKSVTVISESQQSFKQAAKACNAVPVNTFTAELSKQINEDFKKNA